MEVKRGRGRPRRTWVDYLRDWSCSKLYDQILRKQLKTFATHSSGRNATMNEFDLTNVHHVFLKSKKSHARHVIDLCNFGMRIYEVDLLLVR